jgi:hypothetical protein
MTFLPSEGAPSSHKWDTGDKLTEYNHYIWFGGNTLPECVSFEFWIWMFHNSCNIVDEWTVNQPTMRSISYVACVFTSTLYFFYDFRLPNYLGFINFNSDFYLYKCITECHSWVVSTPASCFRDSGFKSLPNDWLSWLRTFVVFLNPHRQIPG